MKPTTVDDLVTAHVLALEKLLADTTETGSFDALNLGAERGTTVREVVAAAMKVLELECPIEEQAARPGNPAQLIADTAATSDHLGWTPRRSDLSTIITDAWRFHDGVRDAWLAGGRDATAK
jgi:UDP-glucose 4-epimerase